MKGRVKLSLNGERRRSDDVGGDRLAKRKPVPLGAHALADALLGALGGHASEGDPLLAALRRSCGDEAVAALIGLQAGRASL
ncbi:MAG: hypothetical protein R3E83_18480 [Burkholderiaceae bacterium]